MGSAALSEAIKSIREWSMTGDRASTSPSKAAEEFGSLVFSDEVQKARLPKNVYKALRRTVTRGEALDASVADASTPRPARRHHHFQPAGAGPAARGQAAR